MHCLLAMIMAVPHAKNRNHKESLLLSGKNELNYIIGHYAPRADLFLSIIWREPLTAMAGT